MKQFLPMLALLVILFTFTKASEEVACDGVTDIGFILDSSGSLKGHYKEEKKFLKGLTRSFGVSKDGSHAGVVTFSSIAKLSIKFYQYMTEASFERGVDGIPLYNGWTRIDLALKLVRDELFATKNGARPNVQKICVLITDGSQTKFARGVEDPSKIAAQLRAAGIKTIVFGIGVGVKPSELTKIAGNAKHVFTVANFHELLSEKFANKVQKDLCTNQLSK